MFRLLLCLIQRISLLLCLIKQLSYSYVCIRLDYSSVSSIVVPGCLTPPMDEVPPFPLCLIKSLLCLIEL